MYTSDSTSLPEFSSTLELWLSCEKWKKSAKAKRKFKNVHEFAEHFFNFGPSSQIMTESPKTKGWTVGWDDPIQVCCPMADDDDYNDDDDDDDNDDDDEEQQ